MELNETFESQINRSDYKILIVDDVVSNVLLLKILLTNEKFQVCTANCGNACIEQAKAEKPDLILLDVMMPGMSGFELAQQLGRRVPIVFLTAKDTEDDMLQGFDLGADDYISKPFSVRELMARVKAVLARTAEPDVPMLAYEGLEIDMERMTATADGEPLQLTKTELEILRLLLTNRGQVFSRQDILDRVWPKDVIVTERTIDVNMARLRKKLGRYGNHIISRQGYGYLFEA